MRSGGWGSSGVDWTGHQHYGLLDRLYGGLCHTITSCLYVFCCCWIIRDCLEGPPRMPPGGGTYGGSAPPPPIVPAARPAVPSTFGGGTYGGAGGQPSTW